MAQLERKSYMNIHAIIQARLGSTRLPGKVFMPLGKGGKGKPLLWHVVNRLRPSRYVNKIIVATTTAPADIEIMDWCKSEKIECFMGSENDVLDRYYQCAKSFNSDIVIRITADDPFKDYRLMDKVIEKLINDKLDFAVNNKPASFPEGLDIEVFTFDSLRQAALNSQDPFEREHMTQYMHRHPQLFKSANVKNEQDQSALRWTIDTQEDYNMAIQVYEKLEKADQTPFLTEEIMQLLAQNPQIAEMNSNVKRSHMYLKKED